MKKAWFLIAFFLIGIFFVSGCIQQKVETPKVVGTQGVVASFSAGAPPKELAEDGTFDISVLLENKGEDTVDAGKAKLFIRGLNPDSFEGWEKDEKGVAKVSKPTTAELAPMQVIGKETIQGGVDVLGWSGLHYLVDISANTDLNVVAQTCYLYHTRAEVEACFNENAYMQATGSETCKLQGERKIANKVAPIRITSVQENPAGKKRFSFIIKLTDAGNGQVYDAQKGVECVSPTFSKQDLDKVYITSVVLGKNELINDPTLSCTWQKNTYGKFVTLSEGSGQLVCTLDLSAGFVGVSEYSDVLRLILEYGYTEQIKQAMTISAIPGVVPASTLK